MSPPPTIPIWHVRLCEELRQARQEQPDGEPDMHPLDRRIVIVGGSSGIGLATAKLAAAQCARVVIGSRHKDKLDRAVQEIGLGVEAFQVDFTDENSLRRFFEEVGEFDHLATPAASITGGPFLTLDTAIARRTFDSKFWGQYNAAKHGAPRIRDGGSIVLFSGVYGHRPPAGVAPIAAVNGAVEALGRALAVELAPIRVNVVSPGITDTPVWDRMPPEQKAEVFRQAAEALPLKRIARPEEIAYAVIYLMTNTFTTGTTVYPDGGLTLR